MAPTTGQGITYPDGASLHPSQAWWNELAATTNAAIDAARQAAIASAASAASLGDEQTLTDAKAHADSAVQAARQALEASISALTSTVSDLDTDLANLETLTGSGRLSKAQLDAAYAARSALTALEELTTTGRLSEASLKDTIATETVAPARQAASEYLGTQPGVLDAAAVAARQAIESEGEIADPVIAAALTNPAADSGQLFADKADLIRADRTVTVGPGGNYPTINAALETLSRGHTRYKSRGLLIEVRLLAGYVMAEQVLLGGGTNLGWIVITSDDPVVTVDRAALTVSATGDTSNYAAFSARNGSTLPRLATIFQMNTAGTATERSGIYITGGSRVILHPDAGFRNAARRNLDAHEYSTVVARNADFSGAGEIGARIGNGAVAFLRGATITGCGTFNLSADGATVHASYANLTNSLSTGIFATNSRIDATASDVSGAAANGIEARRGSTVNFVDGTATGCGSRAIYAHPTSTVDAANATLSGNPEGVLALGARVGLSGATITDTTGRAIHALDASHISASGVNVSSSGTGVEARNASSVTVAGGTGTSCGEALTARTGATIDAANFNGSGAGPGFGFRAIEGGRINATGANSRRGSSDGASDTIVRTGGIIIASGHTGGLDQAANTITANGIIFK